MTFSQRLEVKQSQSLVMTPQLQQAIKLLQLSNLELIDYLQNEIEKNPFLEVQPEGSAAPSPEAEFDQGAKQATTTGETLESVYQDGHVQNNLTATAESAYDNLYDTDYGSDVAFSGAENQQWDSVHQVDTHFDSQERESTLSDSIGLHAHLEHQILTSKLSAEDRIIAHVLISSVNEAGYLQDPPADIAARLGVPLVRVENVLKVCQTFEPTGVFAQTLKECLELQLKEQELLCPIMEKILNNLTWVGTKEYGALMRVCGIDREQLQHYLRLLRSLNPKPGSVYDTTPLQILIPDVIIRRESNGCDWIVELNNQTLPKVMMNKTYYTKVKRGGAEDKEEKAFLESNYQTATWLVKSLDQRASTILRVATEIVRQQDGFFEFGLSHLRPMNLKHIAQMLEMHESTISRVTSNKYLRCPRGIFELKFFFMSGVGATDGEEAISSQVVKQHIKQLIEKETAENILSDDDLTEALVAAGIKVARRTVAKYREALGIGSSVQRRRAKKSL